MNFYRIYYFLSFAICSMILFSSCQNDKVEEDFSAPDKNRFTTSIVTDPGDLNEPMAFTFVTAEEMIIVERKGDVKSFNVKTRDIETVGNVATNIMYVNKKGESRNAEEGLMGVVAHPDYDNNHWIFMHYADPDEAKHVLARWEYADGTLKEESKKILLEYPVQREECCHTGGGMVFDKNGNLYLTTGNNTVNPPQGTSNLDERSGNKLHDDQRTAGNTNDFRGKILRIHPEDDGTYTIPAGNLFPEGQEKTLAEIYTMGHRNPWRISIDNETGFIYWGEVGPDAFEDSEQGPRGYDEFNQAKGPGNFGWPYFIADNQAYADYDYSTDSIYGFFDANKPINTSPNNTGMQELPLPQKAFFWYPYGYSEEFPLLGSAGRSATGGPVFRAADFPDSDHRFPAYFEGKWFITEFMRGWIMAVTMDQNGDYVSMEPFLPEENFSSAIDMQFSPSGDLYVLEYGSAWFRGNQNAQVKQIQYNGGNRMPIVHASANSYAGSIPLELKLSGEGSMDYDGDDLTYKWLIESNDGFSKTMEGKNPKLSLTEPGLYDVKLVVTDEAGNTNEKSIDVIAGNEPPNVDIQIKQGNQTFFFPNNKIEYSIDISDKEDGSLSKGNIPAEAIAVNFDYVPEGFDPIQIAQNHRASDAWTVLNKGKSLIEESDCLSCHRVNQKSIGPSYVEVANKIKNNKLAQKLAAERMITGSVGHWGEHAMSAHPDLSMEDANKIVEYILGLIAPKPVEKKYPLAGVHLTEVPKEENGNGGYLLRVAYKDKGNNGLKSLSSEEIIALRSPIINPEHFDDEKGTQLLTTPGRYFNIIEHNAYLGYHQLDLTGIKEIKINAEAFKRMDAAGAVIEVRLGSPTGQLVGSTEKVLQSDYTIWEELAKLRDAWEKGGKKGPRPTNKTVKDMFQKKYTISVADLDGFQDIYLVFKNPDTKTGQILVQMNAIEFVAEGS